MLFYRLVATIAAPVIGVILLLRIARGDETWRDLAERFGVGPGHFGAIWMHGASNGELTSAKHLARALRAGFPRRCLVITCNTISGRDMVRGWWIEGVEARLAPLDLRWVLARFRARWRPVAEIALENELWPNRFVSARAPLVIIAARMSGRSAGRWAWAKLLTRRIFRVVARLYPQDPASGARFLKLGLPQDRLGPVVSLKSGISHMAPEDADLAPFRPVFDRPNTILAASTHEGEEALVLEAFLAARKTRPALRLILAPRHPRRSAEVQEMIEAAGLPHAVRSDTAKPETDCAIYLADTLGEMPLWYALAGVTIVGGSFGNRGGHTPFEPAQAGSALIHGPDVANFAESYAVLDNEDAAIAVRSVAELTQALTAFSDPQRQREMADRAHAALARLDDGADTIPEIISDLHSRIG